MVFMLAVFILGAMIIFKHLEESFMLEDYLIIHKSILPDYYEKVLSVRHMMETGKVKDISQAVKVIGISRSTYYKYKDYILEPYDMAGGKKAVLSMMLAHETGILSALLKCISDIGGSVLTITQSLPIHGLASVTISLDLTNMSLTLDGMIEAISRTPGVEKVRLLAAE